MACSERGLEMAGWERGQDQEESRLSPSPSLSSGGLWGPSHMWQCGPGHCLLWTKKWINSTGLHQTLKFPALDKENYEKHLTAGTRPSSLGLIQNHTAGVPIIQ